MSKVTRNLSTEQFMLISISGDLVTINRHFTDWLNNRSDIIYSEDHPRFDKTVRVVVSKNANYDFEEFKQEIIDKLTELDLTLVKIIKTSAFFPKLDDGWRETS